MKKIRILAMAFAVIALTGACAFLASSQIRLNVTGQQTSCSSGTDTLIVLLPGRYDTPDDLIKQGFARAVREKGINADIVIPDLHFAYYLARTAVRRLHEDVILPARKKGYRHIWLAGISLGGFASLLYVQQHPGMARGIVLMAPYLGGDNIEKEITDAGGLENWHPASSRAPDYERDLWSSLKVYRKGPHHAVPEPELYLGYGTEDRFAYINRLLAAQLPEDHVITTAGGHDWLPWLQIWKAFLDKQKLPACA